MQFCSGTAKLHKMGVGIWEFGRIFVTLLSEYFLSQFYYVSMDYLADCSRCFARYRGVFAGRLGFQLRRWLSGGRAAVGVC